MNSICSLCKGACCEGFPGQYAPEQLGKTKDEIFRKGWKMVNTGYFCWEHDEFYCEQTRNFHSTFILRPVFRSKKGQSYDYSYVGRTGDACIFLTPDGCELEEDAKPEICKALEPRLVDLKFYVGEQQWTPSGPQTVRGATNCGFGTRYDADKLKADWYLFTRGQSPFDWREERQRIIR